MKIFFNKICGGCNCEFCKTIDFDGYSRHFLLILNNLNSNINSLNVTCKLNSKSEFDKYIYDLLTETLYE